MQRVISLRKADVVALRELFASSMELAPYLLERTQKRKGNDWSASGVKCICICWNISSSKIGTAVRIILAIRLFCFYEKRTSSFTLLAKTNLSFVLGYVDYSIYYSISAANRCRLKP